MLCINMHVKVIQVQKICKTYKVIIAIVTKKPHAYIHWRRRFCRSCIVQILGYKLGILV